MLIVTSCKSAIPSPHAGPSVHACSVHACNAGNVNDRLNRGLESRVGACMMVPGNLSAALNLEHTIRSEMVRY
jgi:hypothetical protein